MPTQVVVNGTWLPCIGGVGNLKWSSMWAGGSEEASWSMALAESFSNPSLVTGSVVELKFGSQNVWKGILYEPDRSEDGWNFTASGMYDELNGYLCLDSGGDTTSVPDTAIDEAISRGLECSRPTSISSTEFAEGDETDQLNYLGDLMGAWATSQSKRWYVNPDGQILAATDPTDPKWYLKPGSVRLGVTDEDYASDLYIRYLDGPTSFATVHVNDATASATRRREYAVDAINLGVTTSAIATDVGDGLLAKGKARYAWTSDGDVSHYQITTPGGQPACLPLVQAGDMARLYGVTNPQGIPFQYLDFIIGRVEYEDGADTISIAPMNLAPRTLGDALAVS